MQFKKISVVGLGYIGLPTAAMFACNNTKVVGLDVNPHVVEKINRGEIHIIEPDLDIAVHKAVTEGHLHATLIPEPAEAFLIAVPTPFKGENHEPDLKYIQAASEAIAPVLEPGNLVVLESTSPVGATEQMERWLSDARPDLTFPSTHGDSSDIRIAHCPERVLPGKVMRELISNDRIIGGMTPACSDMAIALYKSFVQGECIVASTPRVAEMSKLTENSFRDMNIAFANELSVVSDSLGIDVWEVIGLANRHPRVDVLQPGPGVGGHCIAVDPWFIVSSAPEDAKLIRMAREVNDAKPEWVLQKIKDAIKARTEDGTSPKDITVSVYGLAFKPDIDDLRESPALAIAQKVAQAHEGAVHIVEPNIEELPDGLGNATLQSFEAAGTADIHVMLVDHTPFKGSDVPSGIIIDSRGVWR